MAELTPTGKTTLSVGDVLLTILTFPSISSGDTYTTARKGVLWWWTQQTAMSTANGLNASYSGGVFTFSGYFPVANAGFLFYTSRYGSGE